MTLNLIRRSWGHHTSAKDAAACRLACWCAPRQRCRLRKPERNLMERSLRATVSAAPAWLKDSGARLEAELTAKYAEEQRSRLRRGLEQVAEFWRTEDGDQDLFEDFVRTNFAANTKTLDTLFERYNGFRPRGQYTEAQLDEMVSKRYPTAEAYRSDIPNLLVNYGWTAERVHFLADNIVVDAARGSGHAMGRAAGYPSRGVTRGNACVHEPVSKGTGSIRDAIPSCAAGCGAAIVECFLFAGMVSGADNGYRSTRCPFAPSSNRFASRASNPSAGRRRGTRASLLTRCALQPFSAARRRRAD